MATTAATSHDDHAHGHPTGWRRYAYSTNHKDIGTMYLVFAVIAGIIGGLMSMAIRAELMFPGVQIFHQTLRVQCICDRAWPDHDLLHGDAGDDRRFR